MNTYIRSLSKVKYVYVITALFLVGLSIYTYIQFNNQVLASAKISHTFQVNRSLQSISEYVYGAQSHKRIFILLGDSSMLHERDEAIVNLNRELKVLDSLIQDNPEQIHNLQTLHQAINNKISNTTDLRADFTTLALTPPQKKNITEGITTMDSVILHIANMTDVESGLLLERVRQYKDISFITPLYIIVLFLGALFILFYSYYRIHTYLLNTHSLRLELEGSIAFLEQQQNEKEVRAAELIVANKELAYQNQEKENRAAELVVANNELAYQNKEKENRAAELVVANKELLHQNQEKENRAAELVVANRELLHQNQEKENRAAELVVANKELLYQNQEKENRAAELVVANKELAYQNEEKEKRATELIRINNELLAFAYVSSHDLQEPLRNIQMFSSLIMDTEFSTLSEDAKGYFTRIEGATKRMRDLIEDLISYSRLGNDDHVFVDTDLNAIVADVLSSLKDRIDAKHANIEASELCNANIIPFQFRQLLHNLVANSLKFSHPDRPPHIVIASKIVQGSTLNNSALLPNQQYCHISVKDNGIGFEPQYSQKIFEVFQRLHGREIYEGTGIGLAIVQKIVDNHRGIITATSTLDNGATFDIYLPTS